MDQEDNVFYVLGVIKKNVEVDVYMQRQEIELSWAEGMVGALPVFKTYENADRYGDGKFQILTITTELSE